MSTKQALMNEIETLPLNIIDEIFHYTLYLKQFKINEVVHNPNEMLLASFAEADILLANPDIKGYSTVEEINAAMDAEDAEEEQENV